MDISLISSSLFCFVLFCFFVHFGISFLLIIVFNLIILVFILYDIVITCILHPASDLLLCLSTYEWWPPCLFTFDHFINMFLLFSLYLCIWISEHFCVWTLKPIHLSRIACLCIVSCMFHSVLLLVILPCKVCVIWFCNVQVIQINIIVISYSQKLVRKV